MLKLLHEKRSGSRLELVIPVYNEVSRIARLIDYYRKDFDIVLLDGGSTDATIEIGKVHGATIFSREGNSVFTERYFAYYANQATLSGQSFYMFADEHVNKKDLLDLRSALNRGEVIIGNRIDWCYGSKVTWFTSRLPRGGSKGDILYNAEDLHNGLKFNDGLIINSIDIQHLQIWDMRKFLGQCAQYASIEIDKFYQSNYPIWRFIKRFFLFEFLTLPKRLWRQRRSSFAFQCWQILIAFTVPLVALLCFIEARYLLSPAQQSKFFASFYDDP